MSSAERIIVLDCGGQTAHLICRRLRDLGILAIIVNPQDGLVQIDRTVAGIIISGSPASVNDSQQPQLLLRHILALGVPVLGICYGLHWLCQSLGGTVGKLQKAEYGPHQVAINSEGQRNRLLTGIAQNFTAWMSHGDSIALLPDGFTELARSDSRLPAVVCHQQLAIYGVQYHPETSHCEGGEQLLQNFACDICQVKQNWTLEWQLQEMESHWRQRLEQQTVVLLISGGVDSAVVAAFLLRIMPAEKLFLVHFDTGLMRDNEGDQVMESLRQLGARHLERLDVAPQFFAALAGITDPEEKRRIIGNLFIEIQQKHLDKMLNQPYLLAQGTLYTDLIESGHAGGTNSQTIKSHHNVGAPLVAKLRRQNRLVEPLAELYKDEVRKIGTMLGLAAELIQRHPFPGPGLAIRILGEVCPERVALLQRIDAIYLQELQQLKLYDKIWQAFAILLPVKSVGVTGDSRHYGAVVALRAVCASDGMSAQPYPFSAAQLAHLTKAICSEVSQVARVVYDITAKPPATIEWE